MKSMTGYGSGSAVLGNGRIEVELRSLNHRFLEVRTRAPRALADLSTEIELLARSRLRRGRIEVHVSLTGATGCRATLDRDLAHDAFHALLRLRDELAPSEPVPLGVLSSVPDLFVPVRDGPDESTRKSLRVAFGEAVERLDEMRRTEGSVLARDLRDRLETVRSLVRDIRERVPAAVAHQRERLKERIARVLAETSLPLDEGRLEQEVALAADRTDVEEELTRAESHCGQLERLVEAEGEVGRRIEFLLQELSRETNTIGAKAQDAHVAHLVVDLKVEIERMREQSQNVE